MEIKTRLYYLINTGGSRKLVTYQSFSIEHVLRYRPDIHILIMSQNSFQVDFWQMAHYEFFHQSDNRSEILSQNKEAARLSDGHFVRILMGQYRVNDHPYHASQFTRDRSIFNMIICCQSGISLVNTIVWRTLFAEQYFRIWS